MSEQSRIVAGAIVGAAVGAAAAYLFFTDAGRRFGDRLEPALDDLRTQFVRFQRALERVGDMASEGYRVVNELKSARTESYSGRATSH